MRMCWKENPDERPTFLELSQMLEDIVYSQKAKHPSYVNVDSNGIVHSGALSCL